LHHKSLVYLVHFELKKSKNFFLIIIYKILKKDNFSQFNCENILLKCEDCLIIVEEVDKIIF